MVYPAYRGKQFYIDIVIGHAWDHEFPSINRNTGQPSEWEPGWEALCVIRDNDTNILATLDHTGTADGLITFTTGVIHLNLPSAFTAGLPVTTTYGRALNKPFLWADLTLVDPTNGEPYIAARGKGVSYLPTTIGA